jgi:hypothetical protein
MLSRLPVLLICLFLSVAASAEDPKAPEPKVPPPDAQKLSHQTRLDIIHAFNAELVYLRTSFPMGKTGLRLQNGQLSPSGTALEQLMQMWGPAAKAGDQARITDVVIKDKFIHMEINGGPVHRQKWYQHISVGGSGGETPIAPSDAGANPRGSFVDLYFDKYVPEMTAPQLKELLWPVFNFQAKTAEEAYLETIPPKAKEAILKHEVLVGMNRDMVIHSVGRPPRKIREKKDDNEYEEWIYGEPPQDVNFVRMMGDEVVRVETMKVSGEKIVRNEKEVDLQTAVASAEEAPAAKPANAPTLRRPGEDLPQVDPTVVKVPVGHKGGSQPVPGTPDPNGGSGPQFDSTNERRDIPPESGP